MHPIDIVETIASTQQWEFDRAHDNQITMMVTGQWRTYGVSLAWSEQDETLRLGCSFDLEPPEHRRAELFEALNAANDRCWTGSFSFWEDQDLMVFRYALLLTGGHYASSQQIDAMISTAIMSAEKFYPAFQLVTWGEKDVNAAMQVAIAEAYGHA